MGDRSEIAWCDSTWNPTRGCSRVNPDCDSCYAIREAHRHDHPGGSYEGLTTLRRDRTDWSGVVRFVPKQLSLPLRWRDPRRIFVDSMSDLFHPSLSNEEIAAVFGVMAACPQHTFQLLTKRPKRAREWFEWLLTQRGWGPEGGAAGTCARLTRERLPLATPRVVAALHAHGKRWPLPNVWLGVSAGHQKAADAFIPELLRCPAAVHWVSLEPLWERVVLKRDWLVRYPDWLQAGELHPHLGWAVMGGESGHDARPSDLDWYRSLLRQCNGTDCYPYMKQLGSRWYDTTNVCGVRGSIDLDRASIFRWVPRPKKDRAWTDPEAWPEELRERHFPDEPRAGAAA